MLSRPLGFFKPQYKYITYTYVFMWAWMHSGITKTNPCPPPPPRSFMEKSKFNTVRRSEEKKKPPSTFFKFILCTYITLHSILGKIRRAKSLSMYGVHTLKVILLVVLESVRVFHVKFSLN